MFNMNHQLINSEEKLSHHLKMYKVQNVVNKIVREYCLQPVEERHVVTLLRLITTYKRELDKGLFATTKEYIEVLAALVDHLIYVLTELDGHIQINGVENDLCLIQDINGKVNLKKMVVQTDPHRISIYLDELRKKGIKKCDEGGLTLEVIDMISGKRYISLQDTGSAEQAAYKTTNLIADINHFCS